MNTFNTTWTDEVCAPSSAFRFLSRGFSVSPVWLTSRAPGWSTTSTLKFPSRCWTGTAAWAQRRSATTPGAYAVISSSSAACAPSPRTDGYTVSWLWNHLTLNSDHHLTSNHHLTLTLTSNHHLTLTSNHHLTLTSYHPNPYLLPP